MQQIINLTSCISFNTFVEKDGTFLYGLQHSNDIKITKKTEKFIPLL